MGFQFPVVLPAREDADGFLVFLQQNSCLLDNLYLANYANEAAFREDTRHQSNGMIFLEMTQRCARTRTSRDWCGYWQGNKRNEERLAA